jgi:multidrug resistance efflux pump
LALFATEYYSKAEPKELFRIKSAINGEVVFVDVKQEGTESAGDIVIKIDDKIDRADLKASKQKLKYLLSNISLMRQSLENSKKVANINGDNYNRVKNLSSYSKIQKDAKLLSMINSQNSLISLKTSLENLKTQKEDLKLKIKSLEDKIEKKNISVKKGDYIYKIYPRERDYLNPGSALMETYDISAARLVIYLSSDELEGVENKKIYLDNKETNYKIDKIWKVTDSVNISSYRVEIVIDKPKQFSKLVKIEFK